MPHVLCSNVLQHINPANYREGKEQSEYANNKARNEAICVWLQQLLFDACSKQPQAKPQVVSDPTTGFYHIK